MTLSLADESALLRELRSLADQGRYREVADRLTVLPRERFAGRTPFLMLAAEVHGRLGDLPVADRWASEAFETAHGAGDWRVETRALNYRGNIAIERGDSSSAERFFETALERFRQDPDHAAQARCLNNLGVVANLRGNAPGALANYQLALAAYQQAGSIRGMAETHHNIGISRRDRGDLDGALAAADEAVRLARQSGDASLAAQALAGRAEVHLALGETALAAVEIERARQACEAIQDPVGQAETWRLGAAVARAGGDVAGAVRQLQRAAELARGPGGGSAHTLAEIERDLGAALAAVGDGAGARAARERARALYQGLGASHAAEALSALLA